LGFPTDALNTSEPVGAWLASEEALKSAKSFAGKPCSYRSVASTKRVSDAEL